MSLSLVPVTSRPSVVRSPEGWNVVITIHDSGYLDTKRILRNKVLSVHPDRMKKGGSAKFREYMKKYRRFLREERTFYWKLGLMPPDWRGPLQAPPRYALTVHAIEGGH